MDVPIDPKTANAGIAIAAAFKKMKTPTTSSPDQDNDNDNDSTPNYTKTNDPDVYMGKHGVPIKRSEYQASLKQPGNNMKFNSFEDYADYTGKWAKPVNTPTGNTPPAAPKIMKPTPNMSDKAKGQSSSYYTPNH